MNRDTEVIINGNLLFHEMNYSANLIGCPTVLLDYKSLLELAYEAIFKKIHQAKSFTAS